LKDNRKSERIDARLRCWCEGDNVTFYARIANLSEGGLFLRTRTPLGLGSKAVLRFQTDDPREEVRAEATVVWTRAEQTSGPAGMGLRFEQVDSRIVDAIRRIMADEQRSKSRSI
jgi:uncharacterized protein (TIGR02266 family)